MTDYRSKIREVEDFPTPGVGFKDITPLLAEAADDLADAQETLALRLLLRLLLPRRARHAMKVILYLPICSSSPSASGARSIRFRLTKVPFSEPWSSTV